jgi:hypothetical protein
MEAPGDEFRQLLEQARDRAQRLVHALRESADDAGPFAAGLSPPSAKGQAQVIGAALEAAEQTLAALQAAAELNTDKDDAL